MSKKHGGKAASSGWPRGTGGGTARSNKDEIGRLAARLSAGRVSQEDFARYSARLERMLREWPEFVAVRPDVDQFRNALASVPEADMAALSNPEGAQRRYKRARTALMARVFDDELPTMLHRALLDASDRAGSPDDRGALALMLYSLDAWAEGRVPLDEIPLLNALLAISFADLADFMDALGAVTIDESAPEAEREAKAREAMFSDPVLRMDARRKIHRLASRLTHYITGGVLTARLPDDALEPLASDLLRQIEERAAGRQGEPATPLTDKVRQFAEAPANNPLFEQFVADLKRQAEEATEEPLATRLRGLVTLCQNLGEPASAIRALVCEASLRRLLSEETPPSTPGDAQDSAQETQAGSEPPPA